MMLDPQGNNNNTGQLSKEKRREEKMHLLVMGEKGKETLANRECIKVDSAQRQEGRLTDHSTLVCHQGGQGFDFIHRHICAVADTCGENLHSTRVY